MEMRQPILDRSAIDFAVPEHLIPQLFTKINLTEIEQIEEVSTMEPISLIIEALVAGAAKAAGNAAPDVYNGLKSLIKHKFAGEQKAEMVLEEHEQDPETYEAPLKKKLKEAGADKDEEIIQKAQELLKKLKSEESASGKYNLNVAGDIKGVVGDVSGGEIHQSIS